MPAFTTTHSTGFEPVGQVFGGCVYHLGYVAGSCGYAGRGRPVRIVELGGRRKALRQATHRALSRLAAAGRRVGADGVIDVSLRWSPSRLAVQTMEVTATGTAVRGRGAGLPHLSSPFLCDLSGRDVSLLLRSGWVPTGVVVGFAMTIRHDDYQTRRSSRVWSGNQELDGVSRLATATRQRARQRAEADVVALGGTGLVVRAMTMRTWRQAVTQRSGAGQLSSSTTHYDHLAEASFVGTAIVRMSRRGRTGTPAPLPVLRLTGATVADVRHRST